MARNTVLFSLFLASLIMVASTAGQSPTRQPNVSLGFGGQFLLRVTYVEAGSPAESAGLKPGDIVRRIGPRPIHSVEDLKQIVSSHAPGEIVEIAYERPDSQGTLKQPVINRTTAQLRAFSR